MLRIFSHWKGKRSKTKTRPWAACSSLTDPIPLPVRAFHFKSAIFNAFCLVILHRRWDHESAETVSRSAWRWIYAPLPTLLGTSHEADDCYSAIRSMARSGSPLLDSHGLRPQSVTEDRQHQLARYLDDNWMISSEMRITRNGRRADWFLTGYIRICPIGPENRGNESVRMEWGEVDKHKMAINNVPLWCLLTWEKVNWRTHELIGVWITTLTLSSDLQE
jgi:hypothetical protein